MEIIGHKVGEMRSLIGESKKCVKMLSDFVSESGVKNCRGDMSVAVAVAERVGWMSTGREGTVSNAAAEVMLKF